VISVGLRYGANLEVAVPSPVGRGWTARALSSGVAGRVRGHLGIREGAYNHLMSWFKKQIRVKEELLKCSFCDKPRNKVERLISSPAEMPRVYICNECVTVCNAILEEEKKKKDPTEPTTETGASE